MRPSSATLTRRSKAAVLEASLPVNSSTSTPAWATSTATDRSARPRTAAAVSSASLIVTPRKPSSRRRRDWSLPDHGAGFVSSAG